MPVTMGAEDGNRRKQPNMYGRLKSAIAEGRVLSGVRNRYSAVMNPAKERRLRAALHQGSVPAGPLPAIARNGDFSTTAMARLMKRAFEDAVQGGGDTLPRSIREIDGMSGQKYRTFINRFMHSLDDARYLEVGSWAGSTATAALYGNKAKALCIDNWSLFGGPRAKFFSNIELVRSDDIDFHFLERDFRTVDYSAIGTFNVYMFDGPHHEIDQYDGVKIVQPALASTHMLIVDDWNGRPVRVGTFQALKDANCKIECAVEVRTTLDESHPRISGKHSDWHNGYFIGVISRPS